MTGAEIVRAALKAATLADAQRVEKMIEQAVGGRYQRPFADAWGNFGLISLSGNMDHKVVEPVTNSQDAVVERLAYEKFGPDTPIPYRTPREAADDLLGHLTDAQRAALVSVVFRESDPPTKYTKRLTAVFEDVGCGMSPSDVPATIFALGSSRKNRKPYLQGAFGMGGKTIFRYARAVVLVTRKAASVLAPGEEDCITVAVLLVDEGAQDKTKTFYYLVASPWNEPGDKAYPFSVPAADVPEVTAGTHLALISLETEGYHRTRLGGDEKTFDRVLNTRLYDPVMPVRFKNEILGDRVQNQYGLRRRLESKERPEVREGHDKLPFHFDGTTYQLPVTFYVFAKSGEPGARRRFVAHDHALVFTSNGQVHRHWNPQEFRNRTRLTKVAERVFAVVDTDELPIQVRTSLFTPDRSETVRGRDADSLENEVAAFLAAWAELEDIDHEILREQLLADNNGRSTLAVANRISRIIKMKGFSIGGGGNGTGPKRKRVSRPTELYPDPTTLEGPISVVAEVGTTKFLEYVINAEDGFDKGAEITVTSTHPAVGDREIAVGELKGGLLRASIAIPDMADVGTYEIRITIDNWIKRTGGVGARMEWATRFEVVAEMAPPTPRPKKPGNKGGKGNGNGASDGPLVGLLWKNHEHQEGWNGGTVGVVEDIPASLLAEQNPNDYGDLASLKDTKIPTILLNEHYTPLKGYLASRTATKQAAAVDRSKDQYATGIGVALLLMFEERDKMLKNKQSVDEQLFGSACTAAAKGVLSVLPEMDKLAKEAGLDGDED